jgi:sugar lactone lactonase YvrE
MRIVVTSASGANGNGRGTLLAFDLNGHSLGPFAPDAGIVDPRGLHLHPDGRHLYVNNGTIASCSWTSEEPSSPRRLESSG